MEKKGVVALQFNWIFIVIIGLIILLFFGQLIIRIKSVSDEVFYRQTALKLKNLFYVVSGKTLSKSFDLVLDKEAFVKIDSERIKIYRDDKLMADLENYENFVFSSDLKDGQVLIWSEPWNVPFKVLNFVFLTNEDKVYELKEKPDFLKFPENFKNGSDGDRVVEFNNEVIPINCPPITNDLRIYYQKEGDCVYGVVCFREGRDRIEFVGEAMIYGAIFSRDSDVYKELVQKAFNRLGRAIEIYKKKAEGTVLSNELESYYTGDVKGICKKFDILETENDLIFKQRGYYVY